MRRILRLLPLMLLQCSGFVVENRARVGPSRALSLGRAGSGRINACHSTCFPPPVRRSHTTLEMYNLPPGGGSGGGGDNNGLGEILTSVVSLAALVAFFVSPLGGIFFAVVNSFFVLSLALPVVLWIGFQGWQYFNTLEGPCPNCGEGLRVLKQDNAPSICLNCGTVVQATADKSAVDFYYENGQVVTQEDYTASVWDNIFTGPMGATSAPPTPQERQSQFKREQTIIDVEIEKKE